MTQWTPQSILPAEVLTQSTPQSMPATPQSMIRFVGLYDEGDNNSAGLIKFVYTTKAINNSVSLNEFQALSTCALSF